MVVRGATKPLVVGDMPFLSYQTSIEDGIRNAGRFLKEAGAAAVKIEGGAVRAPLIEALCDAGVPVMGHLGLLPQSVHMMGGYKVQREEDRLMRDARTLQEAGAFSVVLEGIPEPIAESITAALDIPTIGIGAGRHCDVGGHERFLLGCCVVATRRHRLSYSKSPLFVGRVGARVVQRVLRRGSVA